MSQKPKPDKKAHKGIFNAPVGEYLFIILPIIINSSYHLINASMTAVWYSNQWTYVSTILAGTSILKLSSKFSTIPKAANEGAVKLIFSILIVILIISATTLALSFGTIDCRLLVANIGLFILCTLTFFYCGAFVEYISNLEDINGV